MTMLQLDVINTYYGESHILRGVSRLARYNVTAESLSEGSDKVAYFEGTPIPTSVLLTAVIAWAAGELGLARTNGVRFRTAAGKPEA